MEPVYYNTNSGWNIINECDIEEFSKFLFPLISH